MRRNQGSGGARSPEMSGAAEKLMAKGFKTHLKATEATHAGPKSQKTKMSQATERMMGKALIDSLKASTSTPEPVRPEVAVSLPDLHASAEENALAKANAVEKAAELWKVGEKVEEEEVEEDGAASPSDRTALPAQAGLPDKDQEEDRPPPPATAEVDPHSQANGDKDGPPTPAQPEAASSSSKDPKEWTGWETFCPT
eukprot:g11127.t1